MFTVRTKKNGNKNCFMFQIVKTYINALFAILLLNVLHGIFIIIFFVL